jgi:hypothetical protein
MFFGMMRINSKLVKITLVWLQINIEQYRRNSYAREYKHEVIMALMETVETMKRMLNEMQLELEDVVRGNKAASKRVRKATLNFAKIAKIFRKESVEAGKTKT